MQTLARIAPPTAADLDRIVVGYENNLHLAAPPAEGWAGVQPDMAVRTLRVSVDSLWRAHERGGRDSEILRAAAAPYFAVARMSQLTVILPRRGVPTVELAVSTNETPSLRRGAPAPVGMLPLLEAAGPLAEGKLLGATTPFTGLARATRRWLLHRRARSAGAYQAIGSSGRGIVIAERSAEDRWTAVDSVLLAGLGDLLTAMLAHRLPVTGAV